MFLIAYTNPLTRGATGMGEELRDIVEFYRGGLPRRVDFDTWLSALYFVLSWGSGVGLTSTDKRSGRVKTHGA